jgi:predicted ATPase
MLRSLHLTRFKSFRDAEVALGPFTLLVGTNASGKSNVRDALRFLHGCAQGFSLAEVLDEKWGSGGIRLWQGIRGGAREVVWYGHEAFELRVVWQPTPGRRAFEYGITVRFDRKKIARVSRESLQVGGYLVFDSHPPDDSIHQEDDKHLLVRLPRGGNGRKHGSTRRYLANATALFQITEDEEVPRLVRDRARQLLLAFREMRFLDLSPDAMREPAAPGQSILGDRGENLSAVLLQIVEDKARREALLGWLRALTSFDVIGLHFQEDLLGRVLVSLEEAGGHWISAASASDGTLRFLALAAALFSPDSGRLYFFEEIDNGFHPTRLHLLLDLLDQASRQLNCQIVATTHNPQLAALLSEPARADAILLYRREGSRESGAVRILDLPDARRILQAQDLGKLFVTGWLEDAVEFQEADQSRAAGGR